MGLVKTTTSINLATSLATVNKKVLLIDLDPQGNASTGLGFSSFKREYSMYHVLIEEKLPQEVVLPTSIPNLDIMVSQQELAGLELDLSQIEKPQFQLQKILTPFIKEYQYDYVLIDCPPSLGLLTVNSLVYSDSVLIPLQTEFFALEGVAQLVRTIESIKLNFNSALKIQGIVLTMYDTRNNLSKEVEENVREAFKGLVYKTVIPRNVRISEAPSHGKPVIVYDINSKGAIAYLNLAKELIKREK